MQTKKITPIRKFGPLFESSHFVDVKDPCIVFDGTDWHIFGSGGEVKKEEWKVLHATAPTLEGPWTELGPVVLIGVEGPHVAAPGVVFDPKDNLFHMTIQRDFMAIGGTVEYLVSPDGHVFSHVKTILEPIPNSGESGLYDPHFCVLHNEKYLVYAGMPAVIHHSRPFIPQPDIYLAKSTTDLWAGPFERMKQILNHEDISWHHNNQSHPDYEWGIEGPQIVELPDGRFLLNATCFLEEGRRGTRQRVFFAVAQNVYGPYKTLGPVLTELNNEWESGENGHATVTVQGDKLYLIYQARSQKDSDPTSNPWRYGIAVYNCSDL